MKLLFIPVKSNLEISLNFKVEKLPDKIGLIGTVQFVDSLKDIKLFLEKRNKKAFIGKAKSASFKSGQVIGCNTEAATSIEDKVEAFLYVGSGIFHPLAIALALKKPKPIFIFNPDTQQLTELDKKEILKAKAKKQTAKIKFLSSHSFGILVSIKPGQQRLKQAMTLKSRLEKQGKKSYIFIFDNFDTNQLENFSSIECWINSACPGLSIENPFVWINDALKKF